MLSGIREWANNNRFALRKLSTSCWLTLYTYNQLHGRCLMGLLRDQRVMAGIGNYLCCKAQLPRVSIGLYFCFVVQPVLY